VKSGGHDQRGCLDCDPSAEEKIVRGAAIFLASGESASAAAAFPA
jgi:hypothetical protein